MKRGLRIPFPRQLVRRHAKNPVAAPVRLKVAVRLIEIGRFQQAELLLLAIRNHGSSTSRLSATVALISLWSRLGLQDECGPLFDELANGRLADVAGIEVDVAVATVSVSPGHAVGYGRPHESDGALVDEVGLKCGLGEGGCEVGILAKGLDLVGYLRFASVYQEIQSADDFLELLRPWVDPKTGRTKKSDS